MKKILHISLSILTVAFLFISCKSESAAITTDLKVERSITKKRIITKTSSIDHTNENKIVTLCGRKFNIAEPPSGTYAFAIKVNNSIKKFGIPTGGEVNFTNIDWVKFEFSGQYFDAAKTIKLYRIRRIRDSKCLTFEIGLNYIDMNPDKDYIQLIAFERIRDNSYRFTAPLYSSNCHFAQTYSVDGGYRIGLTPLEGAAPNINFSSYFIQNLGIKKSPNTN